MVDSNDLKEYTPLRIEYFPDVILDVVLNEKPPRTTKDVEEFPYANKKQCLIFYSALFDNVSPLKSRLQALSIQPDDDYIRYGSIICLRHMVTGGYVRSPDFCYKPGSSQFIVYGVRTPNPGQEDWWEVVAPVNYKKDTTGPQEQNLPYGSRVRILHKKYKRWLHSHEVTAPVTKQQEVTTCGCREKLDDNDYWIVEKAENGTGFWRVSDLFILRHESTNKFFHSHNVEFGGEKEITAFPGRFDMNNLFRARLA